MTETVTRYASRLASEGVTDNRCERRRPGGDPVYDLCDRVLGHTGDHAQGRFTDRPSRYITGATWADRSPQREEWDRYREQTSPLRAQRNLEADAIERAESNTDLENALRAHAQIEIPTWEQWRSLPEGSARPGPEMS